MPEQADVSCKKLCPHAEPTQKQAFWKDHGGLHPMERTHAEANLEELHLMGRTQHWKFVKDCILWEEHYVGTGGECEEKAAAKTVLQTDHKPHSPLPCTAHRWEVEESGMKLSLGRLGGWKVDLILVLLLSIILSYKLATN